MLPPDSTRFELPPPDDERLPLVLEVVAYVTALQKDPEEKPLTDGMAFTADAFCE